MQSLFTFMPRTRIRPLFVTFRSRHGNGMVHEASVYRLSRVGAQICFCRSFTIFLWVLLASFVVAFGGSKLLRDRNSPGNIAYLPALVSYIATGCWLIYGTVLVATAGTEPHSIVCHFHGVAAEVIMVMCAGSNSCDGKLRGSSLGVIIAAWGGVMLLGLLQGLASLLQHRRAPKQARGTAATGTSAAAAVDAPAAVVGQERSSNAMPYVVRNARAFGVGRAAAYAGTETATAQVPRSAEPSPAVTPPQPSAAVPPPVNTWSSVLGPGGVAPTTLPPVQSTLVPAHESPNKVNVSADLTTLQHRGDAPLQKRELQASPLDKPQRTLVVQQQSIPQVLPQAIPTLKQREEPAVIPIPQRPTLLPQHHGQAVPPVPPRLAVGTGPSIDVRPDVELINIRQPAPVPAPTQLASAARTQRSVTVQHTDTAAAAFLKRI
jgi:hypothetical protein